MARFKNAMSREYINAETGETTRIELTKSFTYKCKEDNFIMIFYEFIRSISDLKSFKAFQVLAEFARYVDWNTGHVILSPGRRREICKVLNITKNNLSTYLKALVKSKLIFGQQSEYTVNPQVFWKGDLDKRREILKNKEFYVEFGFRNPDDESEDISFSQNTNDSKEQS